MCDFCTGSSAENKPSLCRAAYMAKLQVLLDEIERLQRELRTVRTQYSFCKLALECQLQKPPTNKTA
jgi:hypothetical protein